MILGKYSRRQLWLYMEKTIKQWTNIVSEYDQEMPQSQTADTPMAPRGRATQQSRDTRKTNKAKQIAKLEWTQSNAQQNIEQLQNPTMGVTIDNVLTTTEPPPLNSQQLKPLGGGLKCILLVPILRPRFCCC